MTPQERQLIDDLFDRLAKLESAQRDPEAMSAIMQGLRNAPNAVYALVQTALVQDEALKRADIASRNWKRRRGQQQINPAASSIRCAMRSSGRTSRRQSQGSVPNVRAPDDRRRRPVWNTGQVMQQSQAPGAYNQPAYGQPRPALRRAAAAAGVRRRWRLVPRNGGSGRGRRGRRLAAGRQHPLDDGRRRQPAGVWRYREP